MDPTDLLLTEDEMRAAVAEGRLTAKLEELARARAKALDEQALANQLSLGSLVYGRSRTNEEPGFLDVVRELLVIIAGAYREHRTNVAPCGSIFHAQAMVCPGRCACGWTSIDSFALALVSGAKLRKEVELRPSAPKPMPCATCGDTRAVADSDPWGRERGFTVPCPACQQGEPRRAEGPQGCSGCGALSYSKIEQPELAGRAHRVRYRCDGCGGEIVAMKGGPRRWDVAEETDYLEAAAVALAEAKGDRRITAWNRLARVAEQYAAERFEIAAEETIDALDAEALRAAASWLRKRWSGHPDKAILEMVARVRASRSGSERLNDARAVLRTPEEIAAEAARYLAAWGSDPAAHRLWIKGALDGARSRFWECWKAAAPKDGRPTTANVDLCAAVLELVQKLESIGDSIPFKLDDTEASR